MPGARTAIVKHIGDLTALRRYDAAYAGIGGMGAPPLFVILSRESAKLGYRWRPAYVEKLAGRAGGGARDDAGRPRKAICCPRCGQIVRDEQGIPLEAADLGRKKRRCTADLSGDRAARHPETFDARRPETARRCNAPLWTADRTGPRRFPLADYILRRMPKFFDLVIADEGHEFKARGSAQGLALAALAGAAGRTLLMTGSLLGGYASTLFHLLYRIDPAVRREFAYGDELRWVARYGIIERITTKDGQDEGEDGRVSKRRGGRAKQIERPGIAPSILFHLIDKAVFLRLADVASGLPAYQEHVVLFDLDRTEVPVGPAPDRADPETSGCVSSQARAYERLASALKATVLQALACGSRPLLGTYLQTLLAWPDACTREEVVVDPDGDRVIASAPALPADRRYPKELALLDLARRERAAGRRVLVFVTHTETRDLTPRITAILATEGLRVAVLKAHTVAADRREDWVAARVREGVDVLVCNPRIVQTGLDLLDFPTIVWSELDYSTYVMRQASRRSWRIGQRQPVHVYFFTYRGTLQADALHLVGKKVRASLLIEGELPEDGIAGLEADDDHALIALARRLVEPAAGGNDGHGSLEALFAQARTLEAEADEQLVDWAGDPQFREAIEAHFAEVEEDPAAATPELASASAAFPPVPSPATPCTVGVPGVQGTLDLPAAMPQPSRVAPARPPGGDTGVAAQPAPPAPEPAPGALAGAPVLSFEELARELAGRRGRRKGAKAIPRGQLSMFGC